MVDDTTKKVYIACLTSKRHEEFMEAYLNMIDSFTYPNIHLHIIENTSDGGVYYEKLKEDCKKHKNITKVKRYNWEPEKTKELIFEMITKVKNMHRTMFLEGDYELYFSLDVDTIIPPYSIELLIEDNKDNVGFPTPIWDHEPCVFKIGGGHKKRRLRRNYMGEIIETDDKKPYYELGWSLDVYSWNELIALMRKNHSNLHRVYGVGNGCLMSKRKVIEEVKWEMPHNYSIGEDIIWYENTYQKGFESWVDMRVIPIHKHAGWLGVPTWLSQEKIKMYIIEGKGGVMDQKNLTLNQIKKTLKTK